MIHNSYPYRSAPRVVTEVIEYDDKGRVVKRTTTTTETAPPYQPWVPPTVWSTSGLRLNSAVNVGVKNGDPGWGD